MTARDEDQIICRACRPFDRAAWDAAVRRAMTTEAWRALNNEVHRAFERECAVFERAYKAVQAAGGNWQATQPHAAYVELETLCTLTHEIMRMRGAIGAMMREVGEAVYGKVQP